MALCERCCVKTNGSAWCPECHAVVLRELADKTAAPGTATDDGTARMPDYIGRNDGLHRWPISLRPDARHNQEKVH